MPEGKAGGDGCERWRWAKRSRDETVLCGLFAWRCVALRGSAFGSRRVSGLSLSSNARRNNSAAIGMSSRFRCAVWPVHSHESKPLLNCSEFGLFLSRVQECRRNAAESAVTPLDPVSAWLYRQHCLRWSPAPTRSRRTYRSAKTAPTTSRGGPPSAAIGPAAVDGATVLNEGVGSVKVTRPPRPFGE